MMEIDIIEYTDEQFAALSAGQLQQVISAQKKKVELELNFEKKLAEKRAEFVDNGMLHTSLWRRLKHELLVECDREIAQLREGLLLYLHYTVKPKESEILTCPYELDYSLSLTDRYLLVKAYYDKEFTDPWARFEAFKHDDIAVTYLGQMYASLYDVFRFEAEGSDGLPTPEP